MRKTLLLAAAIFTFSANAQKIKSFGITGMVAVKLENISRPLSSIPEKAPTEAELKGPKAEKDNPSLERPHISFKKGALPIGEDPAIQNMSQPANAIAATTVNNISNWAGLSAAVQPSDNSIAVGRNHVVQMTNNSVSTYIRVWNKAGTVLISNKLASDITGITDYGDPNLLYDEQADRYLFVLLYSKSAKKLVLAASTTPDPTGTWYTYSFTTANGFPDYPKIGVWGNSYFITTNSSQPSIYALNRSAILAGQAIGTAQLFSLSKFGSLSFQSASPISQAGPVAPATNAPASVIRVADDAWSSTTGPDRLEIYKLNINWTNTTLSNISGPFNLYTSAYNSNLCGFGSSGCIPQPGANTKLLDPLSDIVMDKVQYRNFGTFESITCSHICNADGNGKAGIRWYELRKSGTSDWNIYQQSTWSPDINHRFMSSIAMNQNGQVALGYNISSSSVFPGIRITGRDSCDPINNMTVPEAIVKSGAAANSSNRYGDYNGMVVDPVDNSFWFTANYNPTSSWSTNVVHFSLSSCPVAIIAKNTEAIKAEQGIRVYPNPVNNVLNIELLQKREKSLLAVYDATGKMVFEGNLHGNLNTISTAGWASGIYFIQIRDEKGQVVYSEKLIRN